MSGSGKRDKGNKEQRKKSKLNPKEKKKLKTERRGTNSSPVDFWHPDREQLKTGGRDVGPG